MTHRPMYRVAQVAELLGKGRHHVLALIAAGKLPASDISLNAGSGGRPSWRISADDLDAFLASRVHAPKIKPRRKRQARRSSTEVKKYF